MHLHTHTIKRSRRKRRRGRGAGGPALIHWSKKADNCCIIMVAHHKTSKFTHSLSTHSSNTVFVLTGKTQIAM